MNEVIPPPSTETPDGEEAPKPLTYERWAELIDETPERFQWHSINENPDHPLFGTISKEVTYTTGENRSKKYPVTMPFNRKKNSDDWNIPEKGSVVEVVLEEDLDGKCYDYLLIFALGCSTMWSAPSHLAKSRFQPKTPRGRGGQRFEIYGTPLTTHLILQPISVPNEPTYWM